MHASIINEIVLLVVAAFIGGFVARTVKIPPVIGYLVGGVLFGAIGKVFVPSYEHLFHLSEIGITLLLFTLGFEVSLKTLLRLNKKVVYVALLQMILCAVIFLPILLLFQFTLPLAIFFAVLFSFSSSAIVLKILEERGMTSNFPGNNVFIILLLQNLFIIPVIFLMPLLFSNDFQVPGTIIEFLLMILKPLAAFVILYVLSNVLLPRLLHVLYRYPQQELVILATIFTAVASIGLLMFVGLPLPIAAFFAGVLVSEEGKNLAPLSIVKSLRDILLVFFFVLIGMFIDIGVVLPVLPMIVVVTILILVAKFFVLFFVLRFFSFLPSANIFISSHLANIGEFAVVIAHIAFTMHFINEGDYQSLLVIFASSLIMMPAITGIAKRFFGQYSKTQFVKKLMGDSHYFIRTNFEKIENHVVILGHGGVGKEVRNLLDMGEIPYVVVDFDRRTIDALAKNMKNALYGDPTDMEILKNSEIKKAKLLVVALQDSLSQKVVIKNALKLNPKIIILCRSHLEDDKYELVNLGVNTIVVPEFEAGLRIGKKVLELLGFSDNKTIELLRKLRKFHLVH